MEKHSSRDENKRYLKQHVNPILEQMVSELLRNQPEDPVQFMQQWARVSGREIERKIQLRIVERPEGIETTSESEEHSEDEELDTAQEHAEFKRLVQKQEYAKPRTSVSAEAYGEHNQRGSYKAPVYPKPPQQKEAILSKLQASFLFSALERPELDVIVEAMKERVVDPSTVLIRQGDKGDELYIVMAGQLDCFKQSSQDSKPKFLQSYFPGDVFGELALLYNAPRAATIIAKTQCLLFTLDRLTFNFIVKDAVIGRRAKFHQFISKIELLESLTEAEKDKVCDCLQIVDYRRGAYIIREGETGNTFYFILAGVCAATQKDKASNSEKKVFEFKEYDYFGELSLLRDEARAASVVAQTEVTVASIDRSAFKRLLGPLEAILKRNAERYKKFV